MKKIYLLILIPIALLPLKELFHPGAFKAHDFIEHAARLASFYESLKQGNIVPRWGANLNYTYGHPVLMFLYPLTNYLGSLIHLLGFNIIDSVKILFGLSYLASGIFMFFWINSLWGSKAGFISAVFYLFAPYRFVDLYVRAALGEHLAFVFIPLTCWMFGELIKKNQKKYFLFASLSLAGLILSHNAFSLIFLPFILFYCLWLLFYHNQNRRPVIFVMGAFALGFGLAAFYWLPAFIEGKYTLREFVTTREVFVNNYLHWRELFVSQWGYGGSAYKGSLSGFSVSLGWFQWLAVLISLVILPGRKKSTKLFIAVVVLYFFLAIFLTTSLSRFLVNYLPLVYRFQFPWRFLAVAVFMPALLAGYLTHCFLKKNKHIFLFIVLAVVLSTISCWQIQGKDRDYSDTDLLNKYTGTTETGESTPRWALRFQEKYPEAKVQLVWGKLDSVVLKKWSFEEHNYSVKVSEASQLVDNTLYFPGWKVWVDGEEAVLNFFDLNWRGLITYPVPAGEHEIVVKFTRTKIRWLGDIISLISLLLLFLFAGIYGRKNFKNTKNK